MGARASAAARAFATRSTSARQAPEAAGVWRAGGVGRERSRVETSFVSCRFIYYSERYVQVDFSSQWSNFQLSGLPGGLCQLEFRPVSLKALRSLSHHPPTPAFPLHCAKTSSHCTAAIPGLGLPEQCANPTSLLLSFPANKPSSKLRGIKSLPHFSSRSLGKKNSTFELSTPRHATEQSRDGTSQPSTWDCHSSRNSSFSICLLASLMLEQTAFMAWRASSSAA